MKKYQLYFGDVEILTEKSARKVICDVSEMTQDDFAHFVRSALSSCGGPELQGEYDTLAEARKHARSGWSIVQNLYGYALNVMYSEISTITAWDDDGDPCEWDTVYTELPLAADIVGEDYGKIFRIRETAPDGTVSVYDYFMHRDDAERAISEYMEDDRNDPSSRKGVSYEVIAEDDT